MELAETCAPQSWAACSVNASSQPVGGVHRTRCWLPIQASESGAGHPTAHKTCGNALTQCSTRTSSGCARQSAPPKHFRLLRLPLAPIDVLTGTQAYRPDLDCHHCPYSSPHMDRPLHRTVRTSAAREIRRKHAARYCKPPDRAQPGSGSYADIAKECCIGCDAHVPALDATTNASAATHTAARIGT